MDSEVLIEAIKKEHISYNLSQQTIEIIIEKKASFMFKNKELSILAVLCTESIDSLRGERFVDDRGARVGQEEILLNPPYHQQA
jgi:hypothetical protein